MPPNCSAASRTVPSPPMVRQDEMVTDNSARAERALKREMRKQANRESARRTRLRKQSSEVLISETFQQRELHKPKALSGENFRIPSGDVWTPHLNSDAYNLHAEYEELQARVEALRKGNHLLRDELQRVTEICDKFASENASIVAEMIQDLIQGKV